jgi:hypothetical protein
MANPELHEQWRITEGWLVEARHRLNIKEASDVSALTRFNEYLQADELELAMFELEAAALSATPNHRFWDSMNQAAGCMGLKAKQEEYSRNSGDLRNVRRSQ